MEDRSFSELTEEKKRQVLVETLKVGIPVELVDKQGNPRNLVIRLFQDGVSKQEMQIKIINESGQDMGGCRSVYRDDQVDEVGMQKGISEDLHGLGLAKLTFSYLAEALQTVGVKKVTGMVSGENTASAMSQIHAPRLVGLGFYKTVATEKPGWPGNFDLVTYLDQTISEPEIKTWPPQK